MGTLGWSFLILLGVVALAAVLVSSRIRALTQRVGSFDCRLPITTGVPGRVVAGIAQYGVGRVDWWRFWSLSVRPTYSWQRADLVIVSREAARVPGRTGIYLVHCTYKGRELQLQMSMAAYAGLASWVEAAPPSSLGQVS